MDRLISAASGVKRSVFTTVQLPNWEKKLTRTQVLEYNKPYLWSIFSIHFHQRIDRYPKEQNSPVPTFMIRADIVPSR